MCANHNKHDLRGYNLNTRSVSVVIPTAGRSAVRAAVDSALSQTCSPLEVIVVVDSASRSLPPSLQGIMDRIRVFFTGGIGANGARMLGARQANGQLIAFLDDDDTWEPDKLERQLVIWLTASQECRYALISCRVTLNDKNGKKLKTVPLRALGTHERIADYLFRRPSIAQHKGCLRTSTFLFDRKLVELEPWDPSLARHQDWDWVLRVSKRSDTTIRMCPEALVQVGPADATSISMSSDWEASLRWLDRWDDYLTPREKGDFLLCTTAPLVARSSSRRACIMVARRALRSGRPGVPAWLVWASYMLSPRLVSRVSQLGARMKLKLLRA